MPVACWKKEGEGCYYRKGSGSVHARVYRSLVAKVERRMETLTPPADSE
jgi:hypothetical protein